MKIYYKSNKKTNETKKEILGISRVKEYKYLGIRLDEHLNMKS